MLLRGHGVEEARDAVGRDPAVRSGLLVGEAHEVWLPAGIGWPNPKVRGTRLTLRHRMVSTRTESSDPLRVRVMARTRPPSSRSR